MLTDPPLFDQFVSIMEFRVIITKCEQPPTSATFEQLQSYLQSVNAPAKALVSLVQGKPGIIKSGLSYQEAMRISNRLLDFGFDSVIDPPINPKAKVTSADPIPEVVVSKPQSAARKPPVVTAKRKPPQKVQPLTPGKAAKPSTPGITKKARVTPLPNIEVRSPPAPQPQPAATTPARNTDAEIVRGLFKPLSRNATFQTPEDNNVSQRFFRLLASISLLLPLGYFCLTFFAFSAPLLIGWWLSDLSGLLFILATLVTLPLSLIFLAVGAALAAALFKRPKNAEDTIIVNPKNENKLFLLITAVSKICGITPPGRVELTPRPQVCICLKYSWAALWKDNAYDALDTTLYIGLPNIHILSVREFVVAYATELSKLANQNRTRSYLLFSNTSQWCRSVLSRQQQLRVLLHQVFATRAHGIQNFTSPLLAGLDKLYGSINRVILSALGYGERLLANQDPLTNELQRLFTKAANNNHLENLNAAIDHVYQDALETIKNTEANEYYPTSVGELCENLISGTRPGKKLSSELVVSDLDISALLNYTNEYSQASTKQLYQQLGINVAVEDLLSIAEIAEHKLHQRKEQQASEQYFSGWLVAEQFWLMEASQFKNIKTLQDAKSKLNESVTQIRHYSPEREETIRHLQTIQLQLNELVVAQKIVATKNKFVFQRNQNPGARLEKEISTKSTKVLALTTTLKQQNASMGTRLALGLQLNKPQRKVALKLLQILQAIGRTYDRVQQLMQATDELNLLNANQPKSSSQQYQLHLRNTEKNIDDALKGIMKHLRQCPYDFIDNRYPSLHNLAEKQFDRARDNTGNLSTSQRASIILNMLRQCYPKICRIAANIAVQTEIQMKTEKVKKVNVVAKTSNHGATT